MVSDAALPAFALAGIWLSGLLTDSVHGVVIVLFLNFKLCHRECDQQSRLKIFHTLETHFLIQLLDLFVPFGFQIFK